MSPFWEGFEKRAASVIGVVPGLTSGLRRFSKGGVIKAPKAPTVGQSIAPRSVTPPLPTPTSGASAMIAKPAAQRSRGVSTTAI